VTENSVLDEEILYRCIFYGKKWCKIEDGILKVSAQAFSDKNFQPSVDRACLIEYKPHLTQIDHRDGVIGLIAGDVRLIETVQNDRKGNAEYTYKVDVKYRPLENNISHSQIEASPNYSNEKPFRRVRERLAVLANIRILKYGWEIPYSDLENL
jgi:hypothetical protein